MENLEEKFPKDPVDKLESPHTRLSSLRQSITSKRLHNNNFASRNARLGGVTAGKISMKSDTAGTSVLCDNTNYTICGLYSARNSVKKN